MSDQTEDEIVLESEEQDEAPVDAPAEEASDKEPTDEGDMGPAAGNARRTSHNEINDEDAEGGEYDVEVEHHRTTVAADQMPTVVHERDPQAPNVTAPWLTGD